MATNVNPRIGYLTDDMINIYSGSNVVTTYELINGRIKTRIEPVVGGLLDKTMFGSCFSGRCNCGKLRIVGKTCNNCGTKIFDDHKAWTSFARIDLPVFYCSDLKYGNFLKFMYNNFKFRNEVSDEFMAMAKSSNSKLLWDYCQFIYDEETQEIVITDDIDDASRCSYEGLLDIIIDHYPSQLNAFKSFINSSILVTPMITRAPHYEYLNGKELKQHKVTYAYVNILYAVAPEWRTKDGGIPGWYYKLSQQVTSEADRSMVKAVLRQFINKNMMMVSKLLKPSKANIARTMQSHRIENSGRCTIVPAPDLKVDEVYIPRHLMYECCYEEFVEYLQVTKKWSKDKAEYMYLQESNDKEIQDAFTEFVENCNGGLGKYVMINRNPSLYELSLQACKVKLTNDYTIGLPLLLCAPFGGDYDGDTFSFYVVPNSITSSIVDKMSPKNLIYYKKNQSHLYTPSHEIMSGLILATKVIQSPDGYEEFDNWDEANQRRRKSRNFKWQTACVIDDKLTTLARAKLSDLFGTDLEELLDGFKNNLTSSYITLLYDKLTEYDDRTERIQQIQEFAVMIATMAGSTAPKLSELHADLDESYISRIREIESMTTLSEREKDVKIREIYDAFVKDMENGVDESGKPRISTDLKMKVKESSRAKISQLLNIIMPQLSVGPDHVAHVSQTLLVDGMSPTDYVRHAVENRATQDIKVKAVPNSGYTTRQMIFLADSYYYMDSEDPKNKGVYIPMSRAAGRTRVDGSVISKEEAKGASGDVLVRSIVTRSQKDDTFITKDMISRLNKWSEGSNVGTSLISSMTEGLTQSGLSLKHGGKLFESDKLSCIKAPEDCTIQLTEGFVTLIGSSGDKYIYPRSKDFVQNYSGTGSYKKGDTVGVVYRHVTPSYRLDSVINLIGANKSSYKTYINNKILVTPCYSYGSGKITYLTDKSGKVASVKIGDYTYPYEDQSCYFLPQGAEVKKGQRFCTGLLDLDHAISELHNYVDCFYLFFRQFDELIPGLQPELIEFTYALVVKLQDGRMSRKKVTQAINESPSMFARISFANAVKHLKSINHLGKNFLADNLTRLVLPSLFNEDLFKL